MSYNSCAPKRSKEMKPGDIVQLKSGGPRMTIVEVAGGHADCEWFDDKKVPQRKEFALTSLKPAAEVGAAREQVGGSGGGPWS
jgi:uncharacterized protein YodC (DUF2158 family)